MRDGRRLPAQRCVYAIRAFLLLTEAEFRSLAALQLRYQCTDQTDSNREAIDLGEDGVSGWVQANGLGLALCSAR